MKTTMAVFTTPDTAEDIDIPALLHGFQSILNQMQAIMRQQKDDLWRADEIADYLKLSKKTVQNRVLNSHSFPPPRLLDIDNPVKRWVPKEVKAWSLKHH